MDILLLAMATTVFLLGLALISNRARRRQDIAFELKPNCLLTRWPLLFVTGPRSIFYFSSYWNLYTAFLAEHGYEVFTLHLPWNKTNLRKERFEHFLKQQEDLGRHFHLVVDAPTWLEFQDLLRQRRSASVISITEITDPEQSSPQGLQAFPIPTADIEMPVFTKGSVFLNISYHLHKQFVRRKNLNSLSSLGALPESALNNSLLLLERAQTLAEMDLRDS
ncbi:hypothetical protein EZJ49_12500 [Bdellovibrio bacteriovorus]|uniref:hypothetical protein n=1 Tax=Bdellovibrio bacteriovorus TaxID=959 RepID=UPI0021D0E943|nr:hypothetical protein [Bdellovibrio bacteriovorus]UXR63884.1 hypothetical protein EZJ49_12500 [Bdellovibrio bacteriovorus]